MGGSDERQQGAADPEQGADAPSRLTDDAFFQALSVERRRRLLVYLLEEDRTTVDELASMLAGWEATEEATMGSPDAQRQIRTTLVHQHLPALKEADLLDYSRESGDVSLGRIDEAAAEVLLESVDRSE